MKAKYSCLFSASAVVGIVDAPIDGAGLGAYGRRLANPLARDLHTVARDRGKIAAEEPLDPAMGSIVLRRTAHRGDNGVAAAARHCIFDALPNRAISAPFELAHLLAVVRNVALKSRDDSKGACSSGLCGWAGIGPCNDAMQVAIVASEVRGRSRCEELSFGSECALELELGAKPTMSQSIGAQRRERRSGVFNCQPCRPYDAKNPLLSLELRFNALEAPSAAVYTSKSIPQRVAWCSGFRRNSSGIEKSDELYDSSSACRKRLSRIFWSSAPLVRTKLLQPNVKGIEEDSALPLRPSIDEIPRRPMYALVVSSNGARRTLCNNDHMIRDEPVIAVERKPRRPSSPAAALKARGKHVVKRGRAFGRAVGKARRPMCARKLSLSVL